MTTIAAIISQDFRPASYRQREPVEYEVLEPFLAAHVSRADSYEDEVFNFLLEHKARLGISRLFRFKNMVVDGEIELVDGRRLAIEVKLRMNWMKACQAEHQFRSFLKRHDKRRTSRVSGAIVFFEEFTGDWDEQPKSWATKRGWNHWYGHHSAVENHRMDLVRIRGQQHECCPLAVDAVQEG